MPSALNLECSGQTTIELQAGSVQTRTIAAGAVTRDLILIEQGADVLVAVNGGVYKHIAYPMTRHAWKHLELAPSTTLQLGFKLAQASFGSVTLSADCTALEPERKRWLQSADQLAESVNTFVQSSPQLSTFDQLVAQARNSEDRAAAMHMRAAALMLLDRYPESALAYAQVALLWRQLQRPIQEAGALIGQANLLIMSGQVTQALAPARAAERLLNPARQPYLMTRALAVRCQVQQLSGQAGAAMRCHEDLVKRYLTLGDRTEALMSAINAAYAVRDSGERRRANRLLDDLSADADRPEIGAETRARLSVVRAYLHRDQGELIAALAEFANALRLFEQSTENRVARQAHTMLQIADIYAQLGLSDQAYRLLTHSLGLYNAASAPARVAAALMKLALIDRGVGRSEQAAVWFDRAEHIYQLQGMPIEQAEAALGALESRMPQSAEAAQAEFRRVRDFSRLSAANRSRLELLQIRWLIIAGRHDEAERRLRVAEQGRAPVPQRLMATRLRAELLHRDGEDEQALDLIERRLQSIIALANQAHRGTLGYLTMRSARELREDWVSIALATTPMPDPTRWWSVLADSAPLQATDPGEHSGASNDFGAVLAAELLGSDSGGTDRALLTALAPAETPAARKSGRRALPDLLALRRSLGDAWLLVIVPAEPSSAALWIGPDREVVVPIPGRSVLREQIRLLTADLATPQVAVAAIDRSASALSASLFAGAPEAAAPARLYLFGDDLIGTVPLTLLHWPGATAPLIDTTATGWITRVESRANAAQESISRLRAVVAPGNSATLKAGMATLRYADAEPDLIARTLPQITLERATGAAATPKALVDALSDPQAWVHLAAHGYARPQLLGYAGAWLASPDNPDRSVMLSWLDVIDTPLHAPLAVLNACQLAAGPGATSQSSLSFASAVSAAGVDHVVAAYWPISDSASAVWIPAFYAAMREQPAAHAMDALRAAQIALKDSRAFRHPYYWASLTYFRRLTVER